MRPTVSFVTPEAGPSPECQFLLSSVTTASNTDIRCLLCKIMVDGQEYLACGDRNSYLSIFKFTPPMTIASVRAFPAHDGVVAGLAVVPKCPWFPEGAFVTCSHDKTAKVWPLTIFKDPSAVPAPLAVLRHDQQMCCVTATDDGRIITSGWDSTCKVWSGPSNPIVLRHENLAIWAVCAIPEGYVTLGADKTMRIWTKDGQLSAKMADVHKDVPRACRYIPARNVLVTTGNDGVVKEWQVNGLVLQQINEITVTDTYVYTLALLDDFTYVVGSEDRCAYVVSSKSCEVSEVMANMDSVWAVDVMGNGDVATACVDGMVRVFTQMPERKAEESIQEAYISGLEALTFTDPNLQQVQLNDLPLISSLMQEVKKPGRAILVRQGEDKIVCMWSNGYHRWLRIGKVTATKGAQREKVFDENGKQWDFVITVNLEDGRNLPLYLNYDTNEYVAARDFLLKHNLQMFYLDQIANFIRQQRKPYMVNMDSRPSAATGAAPAGGVFPMTTPNYITTLNTEPAIRKLRTFNDNPNLVLDDTHFQLLEGPLSAAWWDLVYEIAMSWPATKSWPVMDILRAHICEPSAPSIITPDALATVVISMATSPESDDFVVLILTRIIGNMFSQYLETATHDIDIQNIFAVLAQRFPSFSPRTQLAISNAMMNYSEFLGRDAEAAAGLMDALIVILANEFDDETCYRIFYAIGNCIVFSGQAKQLILMRPDLIDAKQSANYSQKVKEVIAEVVKLLQ